MATLDKKSVREELDKIKENFQEKLKSGKISQEAASIIDALFLLFGVVLAVMLERTTKKNAKNSSKPPSQTEKDESSLSTTKSNGKGRKEKVTVAGNTRTIESSILSTVSECQNCGRDLGKVACQCTERRTKIDIIFEKTVEHVDAEVKNCPSCGTKNKGAFPEDMHGPLQYGSGVKAYVVQLLVAQMLSLSRTSKLLACMIGKLISEATLLSYILCLHKTLEPWEREAKQKILLKPCINTDETSFRVDKKNHWIHVYSCEEITLKFLHKKRGKEAIEEIGIIPKYGGVIVHDCWASYLSYKNCEHGLCGSHLLRELTFVFESNQYEWSKAMKTLLQTNCKLVSQSEPKCLNDKEYGRLQRQYRNILTKAEKELPDIPKKSGGRGGKIAKSDAHNLYERLKKHEEAVLLFAKNPEVPFTNNRAERDLRMSKVKQKVSGCFRVTLYAEAYCRISSYLDTMRNKGINPLVAIQMAISGNLGEIKG